MKTYFIALLFILSACANQNTAHNLSPLRNVASQDSTAQEDSDTPDNNQDPTQRPLDKLVGIHSNGEYSPLLDLIKAANKSIDIEIYEMGDADVLNALRAAMLNRGVKIRVVKDPNPVNTDCDLFGTIPPQELRGNGAPNPKCDDQKKFMAEVKADGGVFVPFVKAELCGQFRGQGDAKCYEHGKTVIVDNKVALVSTGNFNSSNICNLNQDPKKCNRDFTFVTKDKDIVKGIKKIIESDMTQTRYDLKAFLDANPKLKPKLTVSPFSREPLVEFVQKAKKNLKIQNQYMKHTAWNDALKEAAQRGVQVELMLTSACAFGPPNEEVKRELTALYQDLESAGIKIRFFTNRIKIQGRNGYLHSKVMIADNSRAWVGSVNGSTNAVDRNREYGVFFGNKKYVKSLREILDRDFADVNSETWQESLACAKDDIDQQ